MSDDAATKKRSGRVRHDAGGRAVWEWAMESGRHAIDSTSRLLKRLDLSGLTLVDDSVNTWDKQSREGAAPGKSAPPQAGHQQGKNAPSLEMAPESDPLAQQRNSFNPYDTRAPARRAASPSRTSAPQRPRITQPVRPAKQPGLLSRLFGRGKA